MKTDMRDVVDAVLYLLRTGCQWRYLPNDLPPKSTVWRYFGAWRRDGTLARIHDALRERVRKSAGRKATPSAASIDSQSVKTTERGLLFETALIHRLTPPVLGVPVNQSLNLFQPRSPLLNALVELLQLLIDPVLNRGDELLFSLV